MLEQVPGAPWSRWRLVLPLLVLAAATSRAGEEEANLYYHEPVKILSPNLASLLETDAGPPYLEFGKAISSAGDVDGDGHLDILIGAPGVNFYQEVVVYLGPSFTDSVTLQHPSATGADLFPFGEAVCGLGDLDADGADEVVVGNFLPPPESSDQGGEVFVFPNQGRGEPLHLRAPSPSQSNAFGYSLACPGDLDGDEVPDLLVGAHQEDVVERTRQVRYREGQAHVFFGPDFSRVQTLRAGVPASQAQFGRVVRSGGDIDGNGSTDLLIAAPQATVDGQERAGRVHVFFGPGFDTGQTLQMPQPLQAKAEFGSALDGVGDVNGDGYDDVLVGAPLSCGEDDGTCDAQQDLKSAGMVFVFLGPDLSRVVSLQDPAPARFGEFGYAVSRVGDVDEDGRADLLVSAPGRNTAMILSGMDQSVLWSFELPPTQGGNFFAEALSGAGDLNEDGAPDFLIGMRRACLPNPVRGARAERAGVRAEVCLDPEDFAEVGLVKIVLSGRPKLEPEPRVGDRLLRFGNVHPEGSTVAAEVLLPDGRGAGLLGPATDGGEGDADGQVNGRVRFLLNEPLEEGRLLRLVNQSSQLPGRRYDVLDLRVPGPRWPVLALAVLLVGVPLTGTGRQKDLP